MNCYIKTTNGIYEYEPIKLFHGRKVINIDVARENLLAFKKIMDYNNIDFGIIYGTLLGAVREQNFIKYDEDVDVFILEENRENLLTLLLSLKKIGFEVARYDGDLLSIIRDDDYIDIYIFRKNFLGRRVCNGDTLQAEFIEQLETIVFLNEEFKVPNNKEKFLEKAYGHDWRIPRKNSPAEVKSFVMKTKILVASVLPDCVVKFLQKY
jgi:hypothetical protein